MLKETTKQHIWHSAASNLSVLDVESTKYHSSCRLGNHTHTHTHKHTHMHPRTHTHTHPLHPTPTSRRSLSSDLPLSLSFYSSYSSSICLTQKKTQVPAVTLGSATGWRHTSGHTKRYRDTHADMHAHNILNHHSDWQSFQSSSWLTCWLDKDCGRT